MTKNKNKWTEENTKNVFLAFLITFLVGAVIVMAFIHESEVQKGIAIYFCDDRKASIEEVYNISGENNELIGHKCCKTVKKDVFNETSGIWHRSANVECRFVPKIKW